MHIYYAITLYELYLRYFVQALRYASYPYAYHTVGSAFAVRAWAYVDQGGMVNKKAGEDFHFLHKIFPLGNFFEIKSTTVYPSPRISNRVIFGTGPSIRQIVAENKKDYKTYPLELFLELKVLFENVDVLYENDWHSLNLGKYLYNFLENIGFSKILEEIRENTASLKTFKKRFFSKFNGITIIHFLKEAVQFMDPDNDRSLIEESRKLLKLMDIQPPFSAKELLLTYRDLQNK